MSYALFCFISYSYSYRLLSFMFLLYKGVTIGVTDEAPDEATVEVTVEVTVEATHEATVTVTLKTLPIQSRQIRLAILLPHRLPLPFDL